MISKELLSEVLQQNVTSVYEQKGQYRYTTSNTNGPWVSSSDVPFQNIYELAHKCKEWATGKGYIILSYMEDDNTGYASLGDLFGRTVVKLPKPEKSFWFDAQTEPEAILKACEWIMEQQCK